MSVNMFFYNILTYSEEFFVILLFYGFLNLAFSLIFVELLWPAHFFNQRFQNTFKKLNLRSYNSVLLKAYKLTNPNINIFLYNNFLSL